MVDETKILEYLEQRCAKAHEDRDALLFLHHNDRNAKAIIRVEQECHADDDILGDIKAICCNCEYGQDSSEVVPSLDYNGPLC